MQIVLQNSSFPPTPSPRPTLKGRPTTFNLLPLLSGSCLHFLKHYIITTWVFHFKHSLLHFFTFTHVPPLPYILFLGYLTIFIPFIFNTLKRESLMQERIWSKISVSSIRMTATFLAQWCFLGGPTGQENC